MSKSIYSYIRKEYEDYKHYSDSTIKKLLPNWCSLLKLVQNDVKKEYEEKLRWIPVEEKLPDISKESDIYSDVVTVRERDYYSPLAALYSHEYKQWISYPNSVVLSNVTEWRRFL